MENAEKDLVSDSEDKKEDVNIKEETDESTEEEKTLDLLTPESLLENKEIEGVEKTISKLRRYRVRELRELYYNLAIDNSTDIEVEKATKTQLLEGIKSYLED